MEIDSHKIVLMAVADSDENNFVKLIMKILEKGTTSTGETITHKTIEALLKREDRYEDLEAGNTLQIITNEFLDVNSEFPLLKYGNGDNDEERGNATEATELECLNNYNKILDEVINHIMTKLSGDNENFVNNEAFEKKIDELVFQYIRETFNIRKRISKENIITNIMLKYNVKTVNTVTNHVSKVTDTVSNHRKFIQEQTQ